MTTGLRGAQRASRTARPRPLRSLGAAAVLLSVLSALLVLSVLVGSRQIAPEALLGAVNGRVADDLGTLIAEVRVPRTVAAVLVGVSLAWAGTVMQGMTRNPLADPGLLGVSAGAAFAVTIGLSWLGLSSAAGVAAAAVGGAAIMTVLVLLLGLRGGSGDGSRLVLAGIAFSMTVSGVQLAITLLNPRALDAMRAWAAGSLASRDPDILGATMPLLLAGAVLALLLSRPLDTLALGDDLARSLGANPLRIRAGTAAAAALLVGGATAIAGPIGFVGLVVPHLLRPFTGPSVTRLLLAGAFAGPALLLTADVVARVALWPGELPVGVVTAALGAPVLLLLIRRGR